MILVEECRLRLDDPIDRLLPELADRRVLARLDGSLDETIPAHRPISLRDLLTLRMGFGYIPDASDGGLATFDPSEGGHWSRPPVFLGVRRGRGRPARRRLRGTRPVRLGRRLRHFLGVGPG
jgi:CubicO group peptidase (beta-lactamase class C family)